MAFARGKEALALCDVCGFRVRYDELQVTVYAGRPTGIMACPDCNDQDSPQLQLGRVRVDDPQGLRNPRPDTGISGVTSENSRLLFSWNPVAQNLWGIQASIGQIRATVT